MRLRSPAYILLFICVLAAGCGSQAPRTPEAGELDRYLQENPEAAALGSQEEPAGLDGPSEIPGEED